MLNCLPDDFSASVTQEEWDSVPSHLRYTLSFLAVAESECQWVFIDEKRLDAIDTVIRVELFKLMRNKVIIINSNNIDSVGDYDEDCYCLCDEFKLIGCGDLAWLEYNRQKFLRFCLPIALKKRKGLVRWMMKNWRCSCLMGVENTPPL